MRLTDILKKAFVGGEWQVGYRKRGEEKYNIIQLEKGWIADPFLFEHKGEHYLFVEYFQEKKGEIAYYKFINNKPVFQKIIISEPYHLSYPCIFSHGDDIYIIPESADNQSVDLYRAISFPDQWEKVCQLVQGAFFDTTYVSYRGNDYLICYRPQRGSFQLSLWAFDVDGRKAYQVASIEYRNNIGRPAGNFLISDNMLLRPAQDCTRKYGERLLFYQVMNMQQSFYKEKEVRTVSVQDIGLPYQRIHTYNSDLVYETVDLFRERIQPFRAFRIMAKKIRHHIG